MPLCTSWYTFAIKSPTVLLIINVSCSTAHYFTAGFILLATKASRAKKLSTRHSTVSLGHASSSALSCVNCAAPTGFLTSFRIASHASMCIAQFSAKGQFIWRTYCGFQDP